MAPPVSRDSKPTIDPEPDDTLHSSAAQDEMHSGPTAEPDGFFLMPPALDDTALSAFTDALVAATSSNEDDSLDGAMRPSQSADAAQPFVVQFTWPEALGGRPRPPPTMEPSALDDMVPIVLPGHGPLDGTMFLRAMADSLYRKYERTNDLSDLERALCMTVDAIQAADPSQPAWPALETSYRARYRVWSERTGKMPDAEVRSLQFEAKGTTWFPPELTPKMGLVVPVQIWTGDLPVD